MRDGKSADLKTVRPEQSARESVGIETGDEVGFEFLRLSPFVEGGGEMSGERAGIVG